MPDHGRRMKAERPAALLQPPADVDVVAGRAEARIEAADGFEGRSAEGHVASGNVLGHLIRDEYVHGAAGRVRHAVRDGAIAGRRDVGASDADVFGTEKGIGQVGQPVRLGPRVVVGVGDDLAAGHHESEVAGRRRARGLPY